jgi:hypothetical protein
MMGSVITLAEARERKQAKKERAGYEEIKDNLHAYEGVLETLNCLPKALQVRVAQYCLNHLVSFSDLKEKQEL